MTCLDQILLGRARTELCVCAVCSPMHGMHMRGKRGQNKVSREDGIRLWECVYTQLAEYDMSRSDLAWACKD